MCLNVVLKHNSRLASSPSFPLHPCGNEGLEASLALHPCGNEGLDWLLALHFHMGEVLISFTEL